MLDETGRGPEPGAGAVEGEATDVCVCDGTCKFPDIGVCAE